MDYKLKKVNNLIIKPLKNKKALKPLKPEHIQLYGDVYFGMVLLLGARGLGKTTVVWEMMKNIVHKKFTQIFIFSSTAGLGDLTWESIITEMKKLKLNYSIFNDVENFNENIKQLITAIKPEEKEPKKKKSELFKLMMGDDSDDDEEEKKDKQQYEVIDYILIIDDMSSFTRNAKWFDLLCKTLRHYKSFIYVATQYLNDLPPGIRTVCNFLCLFKNIGEKKLKQIYEEKINDENVPFDFFEHIYNQITQENKHYFFKINVEDLTYFKNLNEEILISD